MKRTTPRQSLTTHSTGDDENEGETRKQVKRETNSARFRWHEWVLKDPEVRKRPNALAIAGHLMHRFNPEKGYAEISAGSVEKELGMPAASVKRSRKWLVQRGWMTVKEDYKPSFYWRGTRYSLSGGPDDLLLENHGLSGDTPPGDCTSDTVEGS